MDEIENSHGEKTATTRLEHLQSDVSPMEAGRTLRTKDDDLTVWETLKKHRLVVLIAMAAAFSASLDGYQITLNGGIVSNKGFIKQFAAPGTKVINGDYVSAWGGIQSAGQFLGQMFLWYAMETLGRKPALLILSAFLVGSVFAETFGTTWQHWLVAKLFSGAGVGMLQSTVPVYLSEMAPTQVRGLLINAYSFWFIVGQLFGAVALNILNEHHPLAFRTAIYTQWAMVGTMIAIFLVIPESPWWLVGRGKTEQAAKVLVMCNRHVDGYNPNEVINVMSATLEEERWTARRKGQEGLFSVFKGRNLVRFFIASWPKITQQLVGLTVFNTNATYFFQIAGNKNPFQVTVILTCVQLLSMLTTVSLTDSIGRRPLTVYPYGITALSLLSLGIIGCFDYKSKALGSLLVFFACLATFSTTGASAIGYAYAAEIPSQRLRAQTSAWALAFSNLIAIMFNFTTPLMLNGKAKWGVKTGFFFAGTGILATVVAWFILPEVARRTPAEIDEMFEENVNLRKFKQHVTRVQVQADEVHQKEEEIGHV